MRRAVETLGTTDIVTIVRNYQSRTFGFASRNFYVSFLAALKIERDPQKYFGSDRSAEGGSLPRSEDAGVRRRPASLERALAIDRETLRDLNPALRRARLERQADGAARIRAAPARRRAGADHGDAGHAIGLADAAGERSPRSRAPRCESESAAGGRAVRNELAARAAIRSPARAAPRGAALASQRGPTAPLTAPCRPLPRRRRPLITRE